MRKENKSVPRFTKNQLEAQLAAHKAEMAALSPKERIASLEKVLTFLRPFEEGIAELEKSKRPLGRRMMAHKNAIRELRAELERIKRAIQ
jgi:predicted RNase H-like nuclease (RuvC/YqgF family)